MSETTLPEVPKDNASDETESNRDSTERDEWQDILGSGVILKKVLKEGEPDTRPQGAEKCLINYTCRLEEGDEEDFVEREENLLISLGEGDVIQGLDVALSLMNKTERCLLKIGPRLAFGSTGLPAKGVPSNSDLIYDVELLDVLPEDDIELMGLKQRKLMGNKKRERGNWWYQREENTLAIQSYRRALDYLNEAETNEDNPSDNELQSLLDDRLKVLNNMASAQLKMGLHDQAMTSLRTVLRCQPENLKALYRMAKIYQAKNDTVRALASLEKAKQLEPDNAAIQKEINLVKKQIDKQKNREKEYAMRMFGNSKKPLKGQEIVKTKDSKVKVWATVGATVALGLAGVVAYKFK